jgi:broad specificity phosphatase PhoE
LHYGRLPGFSLSATGRAQAARLSEFLASESPRLRVVSSPLERARETAEILCEALDGRVSYTIDERLTEAGSWREGLPRAIAPVAYLSNALDPDARAKNELPRAVADRMRAAVLDAILASSAGEAIAVVSHQIPIWMARVAFEHRFGEPDERFAARAAPLLFVRGRCAPASVTTLDLDAGRLTRTSYWEP